jgi:hypothetical protein
MDRQQLLAALETEIRRHDFDCFVTEPPSIAQGGKGVVVPGCPACKNKFTPWRSSRIIWSRRCGKQASNYVSEGPSHEQNEGLP